MGGFFLRWFLHGALRVFVNKTIMIQNRSNPSIISSLAAPRRFARGASPPLVWRYARAPRGSRGDMPDPTAFPGHIRQQLVVAGACATSKRRGKSMPAAPRRACRQLERRMAKPAHDDGARTLLKRASSSSSALLLAPRFTVHVRVQARGQHCHWQPGRPRADSPRGGRATLAS